ncbi:hypothetical protein HNQ80_003297 [Anaerosolibacter carboniphilus]|uniref:Uncharacterized protein n=1 Tax=Anaerosolibacter carboniphilus TaxID=1417629 RepID=A0A841KY06_9FIRM|nr:hypothetical protein [Anaerosolibacter carboniphilus]
MEDKNKNLRQESTVITGIDSCSRRQREIATKSKFD